MKLVKVLLFMSVTMLALSACDGSGESAEPGVSSSESTEGISLPDAEGVSVVGTDPTVIVHDLTVAPGMTVKGGLAYVGESKCLLVHGKRADEEFTATPIWPKGVEPVVSNGKRGVRVPGFGTVLEGDTITAGGSFWEADDKRVNDSGIDPACRAESGFIVFNADSFQQ
ncbi:hypothetical protein [Streptomyces europaeiscabiei]|uniref:hypothetical protein n=1 Tax=Streptomyces europaeiscabiei TaxID=146819 RepID=UPI0029BD51C7|nr:hypothetical protein [Streptomyces europaeiscabiei]MDX3617198.1 hypothetical protein [Streptomyces europaeiscabiei]